MPMGGVFGKGNEFRTFQEEVSRRLITILTSLKLPHHPRQEVATRRRYHSGNRIQERFQRVRDRRPRDGKRAWGYPKI
jgi:hypothetical protein